MKYCCEKCFSGLEDFRDYILKNHEKTGKCDYCGEENVKLISVSKMSKPFSDLIEENYYTIDRSEADCEGDLGGVESYVFNGEYPAYSLADLFDHFEDTFLADYDFQLNEQLFYDVCDDLDDDVLYLSKGMLPDEIKKIFE